MRRTLCIGLLLLSCHLGWAQPQESFGQDATNTLTERGVLKGRPDGSQQGAQAVTRTELAEIMDRLERLLSSQHEEYAGLASLDLVRSALQELREDLEVTETQLREAEGTADQLD